MKTLDEYLNIALKINQIAGDFALKEFGNRKESFHKQDLEYGIEEDKKTNALYEEFLKKETPEVALYTEEGEQNLDSELVWTIDPIDGTTNYSKGLHFFNTQIALLQNKEPVIAIIYAVALNQKFTAIKGRGAFLNDKKIEASKITELDKAVFSITSGNNREDRKWMAGIVAKFLAEFKSPRILSSCGLELAYAAAGLTDLFICKGSKIWDLVPGVLIMKEAGGVMTNLKNQEWTIDDNNLIASNESLVNQALKLL